MFIGSTLQIDLQGNSSTVTTSRIAGFGGAPNMGSDARGRRHPSAPWLQAGKEADPDGPPPLRRGRQPVRPVREALGGHKVPPVPAKAPALTPVPTTQLQPPPPP